MSSSRRLLAWALAASLSLGCLALRLDNSPLASVSASPGDSLYPIASDRYGVGVNRAYGYAADYDVAQLKAGWYVDWGTQSDPAYPAGLDYMQIVRASGGTFSPDPATFTSIAGANLGMTWIVGNEPDCVWQGDSTPDEYAQVYHEVYTALKQADPTSQVTIGGIVQVTPLRLQWLEAVIARYQARYGTPMPVDLWNIHTFILQEKSCYVYPYDCWGCEIPPGVVASVGMEWGLDDHDRLDLIQQQIVRFRQWMRDRGDREKELIVSEYGILLPDSFGYDAPRVQTFMLGTFDYFSTATDPELGCPSDGNRLVQRWAWYSLNDKRFEGYTSHSHLFEPSTKELTPLGIAFRDYVSPLYVPYVDLLPLALQTFPPPPLMAREQPITITLTAHVRNAGNIDTGDVPVRLWVGDPAQPVGPTQTIAGMAARARGSVSVEWPNVASGTYTVGITVDVGDLTAELDEGNNQSIWRLLVAGVVTHLPFMARGW